MTDKTVTVRLEAVTNGYQANMTAAAGTTKALETQVKATTSAVQQASPATAAWGNDLTKIGGILNRTVTPAALAAVVAIKSFQDGQDSLRTETGATGAQLDGLSESMVNVGNQVPTSLGKIGQVMGEINVRTGQTGPGLERLTKQLVDLDRIGNSLSTDTATRVFGDWKISTDQQSHALDQLFRISEVTGTSVEKISTTVVKFGAPLREAGYSFEEAALMAAKFGKEGVNTDLVMSGLRISLGRFAAAGREPKQALAETIDEIQRLAGTQAGLDLAIQTFGKRAGIDMAKAITEGRLSLKDMQGQLASNNDTIDKAATDTLHLTDQLGIWKNRLAGIVGPMGDLGMVVAGTALAAGPAATMIGRMSESAGGLGASLGRIAMPAGAAVAAIAGLVVAYQIWESKLEEGKRAAADIGGEQHAKNMAEGYDQLGDRIGRINSQIGSLKQEIANSVSPFDADYRQELSVLGAELARDGEEAARFRGQADAISAATGTSKDAALRWVQAQAKLGTTFATGKEALDAYTSSTKNQTEATDAENDVIDQMTQSIFGVADAQRGYQKALDGIVSAQRAAAKAQEAIVDAQRAYKKSLEGVADAEYAHQQSLRRVDDATKTVAKAEAELAAERAGPTQDELLGIADAEQRLAESRAKVADSAAALRKAQHEGSGQDVTKAGLDLKAAQLAQQHAEAEANKAGAVHADELEKKTEAAAKAHDDLASAQRDAQKASEAIADAQLAVSKAAEGVRDAQTAASDATKAVTDAQFAAVGAALSLDAKIQEQGKLFETNAGQIDGVRQKLLDLAATYPQVAAAMALAGFSGAPKGDGSGGGGGGGGPQGPPGFHLVGAVDFAHIALGQNGQSDDQAQHTIMVSAGGALGHTPGSLEEAEQALWPLYVAAGGRAFGGPVHAGQMYAINERARYGMGAGPEMYQDHTGAQYLLPTRGGFVTPTPPALAAASAGPGGRSVHYAPTYHIDSGMGTESAIARARQRDQSRLSALAGG